MAVACAARTRPVIPGPAATDEVAEIYGRFLDAWTEKKGTLNVSAKAGLPAPETVEEFSKCLDDGSAPRRWIPAKAIDDMRSRVSALPYVRVVDPDEWKPIDPGDRIAQGEAVESAVRSGFDHGLLTFSAITFDESHETAAFEYSFICGELCGNGAIVVFRKTQAGWMRSDNSCRHWVS